jgi:penicillin amidase
MKILKFMFWSLLILLLLISGSVYFYLESKLATRSGELNMPGLSERVEVVFDKWAIPHIYAQHETDAYMALGFLHAQDRLFQMEMLRRMANGRLAEILGPDLVKIDTFFRTLGIRQFAKEYVDSIPKNTTPFKALEAYIAGINRFVETGPAPIEFDLLGIPKRPFTVADSISVGGYMAYSFAAAFKTDPLCSFVKDKYGPEYLKDLDYSVERAFPNQFSFATNLALGEITALVSEIEALGGSIGLFEGSNAWLVNGKKSNSGKPILANDPHINFAVPAVWYEAHLVTPGFEIYGHHIAAVPVALLGHNRQMGWGLTMFKNDDIDFFREKANPDNPNQVWFKDHWEDLIITTETIAVKGQADVIVTVRQSRHGPIVSDVVAGLKGQTDPISMWWAYLEKSNRVFDGFYDLAHSTSIEDARKAAAKIHAPGLNILYGNRDGNIGWWAAGKIPIRPQHANSKFVLDGSSGNDEYRGHWDFSKNPQMENPSSGIIISANQQPEDQGFGVVPGYYPIPDRALRIRALLEEKNHWQAHEMKTIQHDTLTRINFFVRAQIIPVLEAQPKVSEDPAAKNALEILKDWKGNQDANTVGPTLFSQFLYDFVELTFEDELGDTFFNTFLRTRMLRKTIYKILLNPRSLWWDNVTTDKKETFEEIVVDAWLKTVGLLKENLGNDPGKWFWGKVHTLEHVHPVGRKKPFNFIFNIGPFEVDGATETVNNFGFVLSGGHHRVNYGPSTRRIIDFADPENSFGINPTGQSGYFWDKHYSDQAKMLARGEYRKQLINREEIQAAMESSLLLSP